MLCRPQATTLIAQEFQDIRIENGLVAASIFEQGAACCMHDMRTDACTGCGVCKRRNNSCKTDWLLLLVHGKTYHVTISTSSTGSAGIYTLWHSKVFDNPTIEFIQ